MSQDTTLCAFEIWIAVSSCSHVLVNSRSWVMRAKFKRTLQNDKDISFHLQARIELSVDVNRKIEHARNYSPKAPNNTHILMVIHLSIVVAACRRYPTFTWRFSDVTYCRIQCGNPVKSTHCSRHNSSRLVHLALLFIWIIAPHNTIYSVCHTFQSNTRVRRLSWFFSTFNAWAQLDISPMSKWFVFCTKQGGTY